MLQHATMMKILKVLIYKALYSIIDMFKKGSNKMNKQIGKLTKKVIQLLELEHKKELPIILGETNIEHMKRQHLEDYKKYGQDISDIINNPTYVAKNPHQGSIEYIKEYKINNEYVLVAVRVSNNDKMFARTLFVMTERKINIYLKNGYAKKYE